MSVQGIAKSFQQILVKMFYVSCPFISIIYVVLDFYDYLNTLNSKHFWQVIYALTSSLMNLCMPRRAYQPVGEERGEVVCGMRHDGCRKQDYWGCAAQGTLEGWHTLHNRDSCLSCGSALRWYSQLLYCCPGISVYYGTIQTHLCISFKKQKFPKQKLLFL
jgi:hypothetical protein